MNRILLFTFILSIGLTWKGVAQNNDLIRKANLTVRASAIVNDNLRMLTIRNIDLIAPAVEEDRILVSPLTSPYAGLFKIIGNPRARIRITFLQRETLVETNDEIGKVQAEYNLSAAFEDLQNQSTLLDVGEVNVNLSEKGILFVWLGADLDLSDAVPGIYQSEFTVELEYI